MSFAYTMTAAKQKVTDDLQSAIQADLRRIMEFLKSLTPRDFENYPYPKKPNPKAFENYYKQYRLAYDLYLDIRDDKLEYLNTLASYFGDASVLEPNKYTFGYKVILPSPTDFTAGPDGLKPLSDELPSPLLPVLKSITRKKLESIPFIQGKHLDLNLIYSPQESRYVGDRLYAYIGLKVDINRFSSILSAFKATKERASFILKDIFNNLMKDKPIPSLYTKPLSFKNPIQSGAYVTPSGSLIYIPDIEKDEIVKDKTTNLRQFFTDANINNASLKNVIYYADADTHSLVYLNNKGNLQVASLLGLAKPDNKIKFGILSKPLWFLYDKTEGNLGSYISWIYDNNAASMYRELVKQYGEGIPLSDIIDNKTLHQLIDSIAAYSQNSYGRVLLSNWLTGMGIASILKELKTEGKSILKEVKERAGNFNKATPDDAPALPNMRENAIQFPHQAQALAKLNISTDSAIIDIATGGGKAGILIQDCINLLNKGLIKRPLIVMPNALISQFLSEISFFTNNQVNGFALTSAVEAKQGLTDMLDAAMKAPLNTIFVTTFSWLSKGGAFEDFDINGDTVVSFNSVAALQDKLGIDYVAVDESQNIKNMKSNAYKAVTALGRGVKYKRISTGTLISNKPTDLIGQLMFLDPMLIGTKKDFEKNYAINGNLKLGYKANAAEEIRARLRSGSSYIMYREKDWAPLLPKKVYSFVRVPQKPEQAKVYKAMVEETMAEIMLDPKLKQAWEQMQNEGAEMDEVPVYLLGKFAKLEIFLTAPDSSTLMQYTDTTAISPKVEAMDNLIAKSLESPGPNNKVIVAVHYKASAMHLLKHSKYRNVGVYYDASKKDIISKFQDPNSNIKVLFAVIQSIKEGLNLQIANRIIIADIDWTPGNRKQLEARIFRPHVKIKDGKVTNLNQGKTVYIDTIIADDSADCVKFAFQSYKTILNSTIMEGCPVDVPHRVPFNPEVLSAKFTDPLIRGTEIEARMEQFNEWNQEEIDAFAKQGDLQFRLVKKAKSNIGTEIVTTPWVKGMTLPASEDEEPLLTYLESLGLDTSSEDMEDNEDEVTSIDLTNYENQLIGVRVRCEFGEGAIVSVRKSSVRVRLNNGDAVSLNPAVVLHKIGSTAGDISLKDMRKPLKDTSKTSPVKRIAEKVSEALKKKERAKQYLQNLDEDTFNGKAIRDYLKSEGILTKRQKSRSTGDYYCTLIYEGKELKVKTEFFRNLPLSRWKEYAKLLLEGKEGIYNPNSLTPDEVVEEIVEKPKKVSTKPVQEKPSKAEPKVKNEKDTFNGKAIRDYLKSEGILTKRQKSRSTGEQYCTLIYKGKELKVQTEFFRDFALSMWKEYAKLLLSGHEGIYDPRSDTPFEPIGTVIPVKEKKPKVALPKKNDKKKALDLDDENDLEGYLDDESSLGDDELKKPQKKKGLTKKVTISKDEDEEDDYSTGTAEENLDAYLDDDFDFDSELKPIKTVRTTVTVPEEKEDSEGIDLSVASYNNIPSLICFDEDGGEALQDIGFIWSGNYWNYKVSSIATARNILNRLIDDFTIPKECMDSLEKCLSEYKRGIFKTAIPEEGVKEFLLKNRKKARKGTLRMYPLVIGPSLFFTVNADTHPSVALSGYKFQRHSGYYIYVAPTIAALKSKFKTVVRDFSVKNLDYEKEQASAHLKIQL